MIYRSQWFIIVISIISYSSCGAVVASDRRNHHHVEGRQQMDWWGLPDAEATAGKLFEYRLDQLTDDADDNDDDYGSAEGDQRRQLTLDVYQVSSSSSSSCCHCCRNTVAA